MSSDPKDPYMLPNKRLYGVFQREFSFSTGIGDSIKDPDISISPSHVAVLRKMNTIKLLTIFDIVHIPLSQFIFQGSEFEHYVMKNFLTDKDVIFLRQAGLISVSLPVELRQDGIKSYLDRRKKIGWRLSSQPTESDISHILDFSRGFVFNNNEAGEIGLKIIRNQIAFHESYFGADMKNVLASLDSSFSEESGAFYSEAMLSNIFRRELPYQKAIVISKICDAAYFQPASASGIEFTMYSSSIGSNDLIDENVQILPYFYSPQFVDKFFSRYIGREKWHSFLKNPKLLLEARCDFRWEDFKRQYHTHYVVDLTKRYRNAKSVTTIADLYEQSYEDLENIMGRYLDIVSQGSSYIKFGGLVKLASQHPKVKIAFNSAPIRDFLNLVLEVVKHGRV